MLRLDNCLVQCTKVKTLPIIVGHACKDIEAQLEAKVKEQLLQTQKKL